jgi:hypothetical protein
MHISTTTLGETEKRKGWRHQMVNKKSSKKVRQYNDQKKKNKWINIDLQKNTHEAKDRATLTPLKTRGELKFLLHIWHPSCHLCYTPGDESWMGKGCNCGYNKENISLFIVDTDEPCIVATIKFPKWWMQLNQ